MRNYWKVAVLVVCLGFIPSKLFAQSDICSTLPSVASPGTPSEIIVEQMKERAAAQALQETQRANWTSKMIPMKNNVPVSTLRALCIFRAEVVPQSALHVLSVRAPQEQIAAIEDAVKRLDVPQTGPKTVDLTVHILVASDRDETQLKAVPSSLKPVVDQLKGMLSYKQYYLLDTLIGTAVDSRYVTLTGSVAGLRPTTVGAVYDGPRSITPETENYQFTANILVQNGDTSAATVRLTGLRYSLGGVTITTEIDVPPGKQVVVGKATSGERAFILVVSATIMN